MAKPENDFGLPTPNEERIEKSEFFTRRVLQYEGIEGAKKALEALANRPPDWQEKENARLIHVYRKYADRILKETEIEGIPGPRPEGRAGVSWDLFQEANYLAARCTAAEQVLAICGPQEAFDQGLRLQAQYLKLSLMEKDADANARTGRIHRATSSSGGKVRAKQRKREHEAMAKQIQEDWINHRQSYEEHDIASRLAKKYKRSPSTIRRYRPSK